MWIKLSWKTSLLVISEILGLFVDTLTSDDKCSFSKREISQQEIQMQLFEKSKFLINFLLYFWNLHHILNTLEKRLASELKYFRNYWLRSILLLNCLKDYKIGHPWGLNLLTGRKQWLNLNEKKLAKLFHFCVLYWVGKYPS